MGGRAQRKSERCPRQGLLPVSYTHLDVYKRQAAECALLEIIDASESLDMVAVVGVPVFHNHKLYNLSLIHISECRIPAAHIADELQLSFRVLIWMTVGPSGLAGQGRHTSVPALFPEVTMNRMQRIFLIKAPPFTNGKRKGTQDLLPAPPNV